MNFNLSFWEQETFLKNPDVIVLGGGIVGVNAAISLKQMRPNLDVLLLDRGNVPIGASTRNAGFACFGSVTELLDDLDGSSEENVFSLLRERLDGLSFMQTRLSKRDINYSYCGGYEVFDLEQDFSRLENKINYLNARIEEYTGLSETFQFQHLEKPFLGLNEQVIFNQYEGSLHPGKMMVEFYALARRVGVRFLGGIDIQSVEKKEGLVQVSSGKYTFACKSVLVCTNGFTDNLDLNNLEGQGEARPQVKAVRNQILLTEPLERIRINSCFHYDKGYVYFRNVGNRLLIGGGRNISELEEETQQFGATDRIEHYLMDILHHKIGLSKSIQVEYKWSGILGIGSHKSPILRKVSEGVIFAVRLGGMGVALGSRLGDKAAKLLLKNI